MQDGIGSQGPARHSAFAVSALAEPLTPRELEVLSLLREPVSNKEIAQKLNVTYATTKRHTINIYGKLGVNQRWDAVARAIELASSRLNDLPTCEPLSPHLTSIVLHLKCTPVGGIPT